jgi:antitoxin YefM
MYASGVRNDTMYTIYRINADELDERFLESLKTAFPHKQIEIAVSEADETEYLLRSPANRERLLKAVQDVEHGRGLVTPDQQPFR